mmetsp:Transcript_8512/g.12432  ORF Transcript_8512/g.12432 Transcript_8512/m.12432 type:complete len:164 (-) Transcript_8512:147-638(-)
MPIDVRTRLINPRTKQVNSVSDNRFKPTEILIDNQANVSIVHPDLARNIEPAKKQVKINGVGGHQFTVKSTGFLDPLFPVYVSEQTKANILSFAQVEDQYPITYTPQESFTIHLPRGDITFKRRDGMYVADWNDYRDVFYSSYRRRKYCGHAKPNSRRCSASL